MIVGAGAVVMIVRSPSVTTAALAGLLCFQAFVYSTWGTTHSPLPTGQMPSRRCARRQPGGPGRKLGVLGQTLRNRLLPGRMVYYRA